MGGSNGGEGDAGGGGTDIPGCTPGRAIACACTDGRSGAQVCDDAGRYGPCVCTDGAFERIRMLMVGSFGGTRTSPWDGTHSVTLDFLSDSTWRASCADGCLVFYWGGDEDNPENHYEITNLSDNMLAGGRLQLRWEGGSSTQWGELRSLGFSADGRELGFEFWGTWSGTYGPLEFELVREEP